MCMYKTVYTVYTYQYTWKVTVKDFLLSKKCFFKGIFQGNFNFLETPSYGCF